MDARKALIELLQVYYTIGWSGYMKGKDINDYIEEFLDEYVVREGINNSIVGNTQGIVIQAGNIQHDINV